MDASQKLEGNKFSLATQIFPVDHITTKITFKTTGSTIVSYSYILKSLKCWFWACPKVSFGDILRDLTMLYKLTAQFNTEVKSISIEINRLPFFSWVLHKRFSTCLPQRFLLRWLKAGARGRVWRDWTGVSEGLSSETGWLTQLHSCSRDLQRLGVLKQARSRGQITVIQKNSSAANTG